MRFKDNSDTAINYQEFNKAIKDLCKKPQVDNYMFEVEQIEDLDAP